MTSPYSFDAPEEIQDEPQEDWSWTRRYDPPSRQWGSFIRALVVAFCIVGMVVILGVGVLL